MIGEREEEASNLGGSGPVFQEDVIIEIFSRLPVKILMQLKCVCKSWCSLISTPTPYFISRHLHNYYHNKSIDHGRLLTQYCPRPPPDDINSLFLDPTLVDLRHHHLDVPLPNTYMLGPYDGIYFIKRNGFPFYALWNPATQECKVLPEIPKPKFPLCRSYTEVDGFGFDQITQGFKVVIIREEGHRCCGENFPSEVLVYSGNSNSWCYFELPWDFYPFSSTCYMHLNGVYYWIAEFNRDEFLLSFDMDTNLFHQVISAPPFKNNSYSTLVLQGHSIAWIYEANLYLHVWVLNQDENGCSWTKKYCVGPFSKVCRPLGYWKNDQLILSFIDGLHLCDLTSHTPKALNLGVAESGSCYRALIYKESLVSINGEKLVPGEIYASWRERFLKGRLPPRCPNDYFWEQDNDDDDDEEEEEEEEAAAKYHAST